ncbi:hypothetical protein KKC91_11335 [bacterium]|nr:hypothetical protein [bacterium]
MKSKNYGVHHIFDQRTDIFYFDKVTKHGISSIGKDGITGDDTQLYPLYGTTAKTVCEGNDTRLPITDEKAAMTGANSPSADNPFATKADIITAIRELKAKLETKNKINVIKERIEPAGDQPIVG